MFPVYIDPLFLLFAVGSGMHGRRCPVCGSRRGCCLGGCLTPILSIAAILWLLARIF